MRRGLPSTHIVFGLGQTINSANLLVFKALEACMSLSSTAVQVFTERIIEAHIGQGLDLYWAHHTKVPTEEEYFTMVDGSKWLYLFNRGGQTNSFNRNWRPLHLNC